MFNSYLRLTIPVFTTTELFKRVFLLKHLKSIIVKDLIENIFNSVRLNLKRYWTGHICYGIDNMDRLIVNAL